MIFFRRISLVLAVVLLALTSCIREEALGTECDIVGIDSVWLRTIHEAHPGFIIGRPAVNYADTVITFSVSDTSLVHALNPQFVITPGATLFFNEGGKLRSYNPGEMFDFAESHSYTVVSEDGAWHRNYVVRFLDPNLSEPATSECDIVSVDSLWMLYMQLSFPTFFIGDPVIGESSVTFTVGDTLVRKQLNPLFNVTPGATIYFNDNGTLEPFHPYVNHDFSKPQTYTVVSADGLSKKDYVVSFIYGEEEGGPTTRTFSETFEQYVLDSRGQYQRLQHATLGLACWDSGNAGFALTGMGSTPEDYPTTFVSGDGSLAGRYARLRTLSTGTIGSLAGMPIAAGNLFIGEFQTANAMLMPRQATRFGLQTPVMGEPVELTGYYRYTPGSVVTGQDGTALSGVKDSCDIYAVLFEVDPADFAPLDGDNVKTDPRIVAIASMDAPEAPATWKAFTLPFRFLKPFDEAKRKKYEYAIAIVMTSSRGGAYFRGAVGSELCVDNLKLVWKN